MIFQDPMTSLNPVQSIGWQLEEAVLVHNDVSRKVARQRAIEILGRVKSRVPTSGSTTTRTSSRAACGSAS